MISIIVPVYKVEKWLKSCIDSILCQDYRDFELILVDDGSPDRCGEICDAYAAMDSRVQVLHQKNGGLSAARNAGTQKAAGEFLTYVDSDDMLYPDYLSTLLFLMEKYNGDISVVPHVEFGDTLPNRQKTYGDPFVLSGEEACERLFQKHEITMITAWGKLYRRAAVGDPVYPVGKLHEDEYVTYRLLAQAGKVVIGQRPCYGYRQRGDGIIASVWTPRRLDRLEALKAAPAVMAEKGFDRAASYARKRYLLNIEISACQCGGGTVENRSIRRKLIAAHKDYLKSYKTEILPVCSLTEKITVMIFRISPGLYDCCAKLLLYINKGRS